MPYPLEGSCFEIGPLVNMDTAPWTLDVTLNKTVDIKGVKTIMIKTSGSEKRITLLFLCAGLMAQSFRLYYSF
jgi:hypothetical protein